jgi:hypothetical protein
VNSLISQVIKNPLDSAKSKGANLRNPAGFSPDRAIDPTMTFSPASLKTSSFLTNSIHYNKNASTNLQKYSIDIISTLAIRHKEQRCKE